MSTTANKDQSSPHTADESNVRPTVMPSTELPDKSEIRHRLEMNAENHIRNSSDIQEVYELLSRRSQIIIAVCVVVVYPVLWIIYGVFREPLWRASVNASVALSQHGGFLNVYSWIFSNIFYQWYIALIAILLLFAPRKDSALKSITVFMVSYVFRQYLRLFIHEDRPQYVSSEIILRAGCDCSFGMPSGHSEGSTMLYSLLFYELFIQTKHFSKFIKYLVTGFAFYIVISIMFARVYYGRHSIPQVILGSWQAMFFFALMIIFQKPLDIFFRKFLNRARLQFYVLLSIGFLIIASNLLLWFLYFDGVIREKSKRRLICNKCFENDALMMRLPLGISLVLPSMYLGIILGFQFGLPNFLEYNDHMLRMHLSWKGLARISIMALMHFPMLVLIGLNSSPDVAVPVGSFIYALTGFLITFADLFINQKLNIDFRGDIMIFRCIKNEVSVPQYPQPTPDITPLSSHTPAHGHIAIESSIKDDKSTNIDTANYRHDHGQAVAYQASDDVQM